MRHHLMLVRMAIIKNSRNNKCWRGCGEKGILLHCWWEHKLMQPLRGTVWRFLKKLGINLPYVPAILLLGIYTEKTTTLKDTCTLMFIAALFTISRTWKYPKCLMTDEWKKKIWYAYTVEYSVLCYSQSCPTLCDPIDCSLPGFSLSMDFSRSCLPCPTSGDIPNPGVKPKSPMSPALAGGFFTTVPHRKPSGILLSH